MIDWNAFDDELEKIGGVKEKVLEIAKKMSPVKTKKFKGHTFLSNPFKEKAYSETRVLGIPVMSTHKRRLPVPSLKEGIKDSSFLSTSRIGGQGVRKKGLLGFKRTSKARRESLKKQLLEARKGG